MKCINEGNYLSWMFQEFATYLTPPSRHAYAFFIYLLQYFLLFKVFGGEPDPTARTLAPNSSRNSLAFKNLRRFCLRFYWTEGQREQPHTCYGFYSSWDSLWHNKSVVVSVKAGHQNLLTHGIWFLGVTGPVWKFQLCKLFRLAALSGQITPKVKDPIRGCM